MIAIYAALVGLLTAVAVYLLLHPDSVDKAFGLVVLGHAGNLTVFAAGDLFRARAPVLSEATGAIADPLPQSLVLTAIVISFGLVAFGVVLVARLHREREEV